MQRYTTDETLRWDLQTCNGSYVFKKTVRIKSSTQRKSSILCKLSASWLMQCFILDSLQSLETHCQHPFGSAAAPPPHITEKHSKSPQSVKVACRGGMLNQHHTGPRILPRTHAHAHARTHTHTHTHTRTHTHLRWVLKVLCADAVWRFLGGKDFQFQRHDQDASSHTRQENPVNVQYILFAWFCIVPLLGDHFAVVRGVCVWVVSLHSSLYSICVCGYLG